MANQGTSTAVAHDEDGLLAAYEFMKPRIDAVPEDRVTHINIEIPTAVTTAVGAMPEVQALRSQVAEHLPTFDLEVFDIVEVAANATLHLHSRWVFATKPVEPLPELVEEATRRRELLVAVATMLVKHGLLVPSAIDGLLGPVGHKNIAIDLNGVASLLRDNWATINGKSPITMEDLDAATRVAQRLIKAVGLKQQSPAVIAAIALERQRAFTVFVNAYDQVRRAVIYLRWNEGDADLIAPSLYAGRASKKSADDRAPKPSEPASGEVEIPAASMPRVAVPVGHPDADPTV